MPTHFLDMPDEAAREKYPSANRPQVIMTNEDRSVDFTFSHIGKNASPMTAQSVWEEIDRIFPSNVLYETGKLNKENLEILWLEYKSFSFEYEVYNILFPIMSNSATIMGTFSCPFTSYDIWKPCVLQIIQTIQFHEGKDERP